jgi:hypothetical protein
MIWNYDHFSRWNIEYAKNFHIYSTTINKKKCDVLNQV